MENLQKPKRKTQTSWQVKAKYNAKNYRSFASQIKPELFDRISSYIERENLSKSEFLTRAIDALEK